MAKQQKAISKAKTNNGALKKGLLGSLMIIVGAIAADRVFADSHENITVSHGYSNFGELRYGPDMSHLDYVNPEAPKGGEIAISTLGNFDSFNPYTRKGVTAALVSSLYERLLTSTADDAYGSYCYLCTTMEYPDSKDWVIFNLRDDVTFSDGTPMTAEDVKFTFDLFIEQGITEYRSVVEGFVSSVEILGPHKIKFNFTDDAPRREVISFAGGTQVFSKAWFEANGARIDESTDQPFMGTGAYVLDSFDIGRQLVYGRNENYWGAEHPFNVGQNNFDNIRIEYFADGVAALEGFKSGAYTFRSENSSKSWAVDYEQFPNLTDGYVVKKELPDGTIGSAQSWIFNLRKDVWQDPKVREAIRLGFNFEWSNDTLFYGLYSRVESFWQNTDLQAQDVPEGLERDILADLVERGLLDETILSADVTLPPSSGADLADRRNLRAAGRLLDEAGWTVGDDGIRQKDGKPMELVFLSFSPLFDRIINPYIENLERLGIQAKLDRVDTAQYIERRRAGDYDLVNHTLTQGFEPGIGLRQWFDSSTAADSGRNLMGLENAAVDDLIGTVIEAATLDELKPAVRALDRVLRAEGFWVPQWFKDVHTIAYYDQYEHPETLPPFSLGELGFWWYSAEKGQKIKDAGVLN